MLLSNIFTASADLDLNVEDYVWQEFYEIYLFIKETNNIDSVDLLEERLERWLEYYLILSSGKITPYVHSFVNHVPEFIKEYKNISLYTLQGLEKLNDLTTQYYHISTNKHKIDNEYLDQLIAKRNRVEFFNLNGKLSEITVN